MSVGAWVLVVAVVVAIGFGLYRAAVDGRFRGTHTVRGVESQGSGEPAAGGSAQPGELTATLDRLGLALGERATLVQFSSAFCAPCRAARRTLGEVAELVPGVVHHEIDAEHHLDLVRQVGVLRTPTTLILDAAGHEVARASGAPTKQQVLAQLGELV